MKRALIHQVIVLQPSGLVVYSKSFEKTTLDESLFSGFIAAILAFSKEMGSELSSITLEDLIYYFDNIHGLIVVLGTAPQVDVKRARDFFALLTQSNEFRDASTKINDKTVHLLDSEETKVLDEIINETLSRLHLLPKDVEGILISPEKMAFIKDIVDELQREEVSPKHVAQRIFGEGFESRNPQLIKEKIQVLKQFVHTGQIHPALKKSLQQLISYLERSVKAANLFGF